MIDSQNTNNRLFLVTCEKKREVGKIPAIAPAITRLLCLTGRLCFSSFP